MDSWDTFSLRLKPGGSGDGINEKEKKCRGSILGPHALMGNARNRISMIGAGDQVDTFLEQLGIKTSGGALDQPLRVRVEKDILIKLDRIEAFIRSQGYRDVSRSDLVRAALIGFIDGVTDIDAGIVNEPLRKELAEAGASKTGG